MQNALFSLSIQEAVRMGIENEHYTPLPMVECSAWISFLHILKMILFQKTSGIPSRTEPIIVCN